MKTAGHIMLFGEHVRAMLREVGIELIGSDGETASDGTNLVLMSMLVNGGHAEFVLMDILTRETRTEVFSVWQEASA
jgi:hypothetical protein